MKIFDKVTGCYELSQIKWPPKLQDSKYVKVPKQIWLTYVRAWEYGKGDNPSRYILLPAPGQVQTIHNVMYWEIDLNEGVLLHFRAGPGRIGLMIVLQLPSGRSEKAESMKGVARVSFDIPTSYEDVPVTATRLPCGAVGPD
jgi:hypothetical protein